MKKMCCFPNVNITSWRPFSTMHCGMQWVSLIQSNRGLNFLTIQIYLFLCSLKTSAHRRYHILYFCDYKSDSICQKCPNFYFVKAVFYIAPLFCFHFQTRLKMAAEEGQQIKVTSFTFNRISLLLVGVYNSFCGRNVDEFLWILENSSYLLFLSCIWVKLYEILERYYGVKTGKGH